MNARYLLAAGIASTIALAACGGGGGTTPAPVTPPVTIPVATAAPITAPQDRAMIPMTLSIPRLTPSAAARSPRFLSPGVGSIAIYDGTTLIYVANLSLDSTPQFTTVYAKSGSTTVAFGSCTFTSSRATCTLTITSTVGPHAFDIIAYPGSQGQSGPAPAPPPAPQPADTGTPPLFTGVISSEGELSVSLSPGANPGQTLTMLGVADKVIVAHASNGPYNQATTFGYRIEDSTNSQIVQPGNAFDNGPVTITASP
ncbi:MAG: hypothetical protein JWM87_2493, partial [Candidatus Eremiobacteraeota bacterium]|nr:hypothetical protein [Candidatus Eremiobacteraeota bacterium]